MCSSTYYRDQNYKCLGAFTPDKNLPQLLERELCFVLYPPGNKIRKTEMFNNVLPVSAVMWAVVPTEAHQRRESVLVQHTVLVGACRGEIFNWCSALHATGPQHYF